jgi:hypothetical protein
MLLQLGFVPLVMVRLPVVHVGLVVVHPHPHVMDASMPSSTSVGVV